MLTAGGVVSALETVTLTAEEVVRLPTASRATAVSVCEPLPTVVVFQEAGSDEGRVCEARLAPSRRDWTPAVPTLSEAEVLTVVVPETVAPEEGDVMLTAGGVVSALDTVTLTAEDVVRLPAASRATAVSVCEPLPTVVVFQEA